ncbi:MAG: DUF2148 domain-containing protein [Candidatus Nezhaarchaeales archaeon]
MLISARTAPKARGVDEIITAIVTDPEKEAMAREMEKLAENGDEMFRRDADGVRRSHCVVLIGLRSGTVTGGNDCGACGFKTCEELRRATRIEAAFSGPNCAFRLIDLGIALGSAVKTAATLNVDNRIMYRAGVAARRLKLIEADVVYGIPLSATGKNIFFDRTWPVKTR